MSAVLDIMPQMPYLSSRGLGAGGGNPADGSGRRAGGVRAGSGIGVAIGGGRGGGGVGLPNVTDEATLVALVVSSAIVNEVDVVEMRLLSRGVAA